MDNTVTEYKRGTHLFIYGHTLNLFDCIRSCNENGITQYLHVYVDTLRLGESNVVDIASSGLKTVHVFSRDFLPGTTVLQVVCKENGLRLFIFNEEAPECLAITFAPPQDIVKGKCEMIRATSACPIEAKGQHCDMVHSRLSELDVGREIMMAKDEVSVRSIRNVSRLELAGPNYEDIQAFPGIEKTSFLRSLLQDMFTAVSIDVTTNSSDDALDLICISRLRFITRCLRLDANSAQFAADAKRLLDRLELPRRFPGGQSDSMRAFYVPILQPKYITERLKDQIQRAAGMEKAIEDITRDNALHTSLQSSAEKIIEAIKYTMTSFVDIEKTKESAIEAIEDLERKRRDLQDASESAKAKAHNLELATKKYQEKQELTAILKGIGIGLEITVGIGIAVATCGTGAPLTVVTAADAVKKAKELSKARKGWNILKRLGELAGKIGPKLMAAHSSQKSYLAAVASMDLTVHGADAKLKQSALAGLTEVAKRITANSLPNKEMEAVDFLGIMADWDELEVSIDRVFSEARDGFKKGEVLPELGDFEIEMRKQVIRGRIVLKAMSNAQSAAQLYYRQLAEKVAREAVTKKIRKIGETEQDHAKHVAKSYFRQALIDIKRSVFVLFHECILSLIYYENRGSFPVDHEGQLWFKGLAADNPIDGYLKISFRQFYERLMDLYNNAVGKHIEQVFPGEISVDTSTHAGTVFEETWMTDLANNKQMAFHVPTDLDLTEGFRRIRIKSLRATFDGLAGPNGDPSKVRYYFILGPRNIDISSELKPVQYYIPPLAIEKQGKEGKLLNTQGVLVRPALFCHGALGFAAQSLKSLDLSTITKVTIHFTCEAISRLQS